MAEPLCAAAPATSASVCSRVTGFTAVVDFALCLQVYPYMHIHVSIPTYHPPTYLPPDLRPTDRPTEIHMYTHAYRVRKREIEMEIEIEIESGGGERTYT